MCTENRPQQLFLPKRSPLKRQQARGAALAGTEPQREETSARCQFEWCWIWWRETPPHMLVPAPTEPGSGPSTVPWVGPHVGEGSGSVPVLAAEEAPSLAPAG